MLGCQYHTGELCQGRQHLCCIGDDLLRLSNTGGQLQAGFDGVFTDRLCGQESIDKNTEAFRGRYPACRCMRTGDKAHFLQIGHDVADGRWRQIQFGQFGQNTRADRLTFGDIAFDQCLQQGLRARFE